MKLILFPRLNSELFNHPLSRALRALRGIASPKLFVYSIGAAIKSEKGSTLLMNVVFLALLSIMGMAILTTTASHYKLQAVQGDRKFAFYGAESGIDEAIALLTAQVQVIHDETVEQVNSVLETKIASQAAAYERYAYNEYMLREGLLAENNVTCPALYNTDGTISQAEAYDIAEGQYKTAFENNYKEWVLETFVFIPAGDAIGRELENVWGDDKAWGEGFEIITNKENGDIKVGIHKATGEINFAGGALELPLFSIYNPADSARKVLTVDVTINVPAYTLPIMLTQNVMKFDPNILWTKALTSEGNIIVNSGVTNINGNVYSGGDIIIGSGSGLAAVTINGEAVAKNDISFNASGSSLRINGNAYAKNIIVTNAALNVTGVTGKTAYTSYSLDDSLNAFTGMQALGDVVVENNLELRGSSAVVNIAQNFTGFSEPADLDIWSINDSTSCIVVDSGNSSLNIAKETVICGSSHLRFENSGIFNTGEAIALTDNFMGYSNWLVSPFLETFIMAVNKITSPASLFTPADDREYINYGNFFGLFAPDQYLTAPDSYKSLTVPDRADYFFQISLMEQDENFGAVGTATEFMSPNINTAGDAVVLSGGYYGNGVAFSEGNIYARTENASDILSRRTSAQKMFDRQMNFLGDWSGRTSLANLFVFRDDYEEIIYSDGDYQEVIITSTSSSALTVGSETVNRISGVIVTNGDVIIHSDVTEFRGLIFARGNIIINGGTTFVNDRDFIAKAMAFSANDAVRPLRDISTGDGASYGFASEDSIQPTYSFFRTTASDGSLSREDFSYVSEKDAELTNKYNSVKDIVQTSNWRIVEY